MTSSSRFSPTSTGRYASSAGPEPGLAALAAQAIAGPAVAGACMGLALDLEAMGSWALALPGLIISLALLGLPALYIVSTQLGCAPPLHEMLGAALASLGRAGTVLLGLSPALAFMVVTTQNSATIGVSLLAVMLASVLALRHLFLALFAPDKPVTGVPSAAVLAYMAWAAVVLGIGALWLGGRALETLGGAA